MRNFLTIQKIFSFTSAFFLASILALLAGCGPGTPTLASGITGAGSVTVQLLDAKGAVATSISPGVNATVVAVVEDGSGAVVPNTIVTFAVTDIKLATISQTTALTNSSGIASVTLSATGNGVGATSVTATATVTGATGPVTASGVVPTGPVTATGQTSFAVTSGTSSAAPTMTLQLTNLAGTAVTEITPSAPGAVKATVKDTSGNVLPNVIVTFSVGGDPSAPLASISPAATALTDSNGVAQVTLIAIASGATSVTATATVTGSALTASTNFEVTFPTVPTPTMAVELTNSGGTPITTISSGNPGIAKVTITDANGAPIPNILVTFNVVDSTLASITPAPTALTNSSGVAQVTLTATAPGATGVTASAVVTGFPLSNSVSFSVTTSAPSLTLSLSSTTVTIGNPVTVIANLRSGSGTAMPGVAVTFSVTNSTLATVTSSATTDAFGNAVVTLTAGTGAGSDSISASAPVPNYPPNNLVTAGPYNFTVGSTIASLSLSAVPTTIKTDNSNSATITVTALDSGNAATPGVVVSLAATCNPASPCAPGVPGILSAQTVTTDATGKGTFTFSSGAISKANRTTTITASAGVTAQLPIQITGSTFTVNASGATVPDDGSASVTMTFTALDAGGNPISGAAVTFTKPTGVTLTPSSGSTNASGQLVVTVTGGAGFTCVANCVVSANAVGLTATAPINVTSSSATFSIIETQLNSNTPLANPTAASMQIGDSLVVLVNDPNLASSVVFASTLGSWNASGSTVTVAVGAGTVCGSITTIAGQACATLTTSVAGLANVQVYDANNVQSSDSMKVSMTATTPYSITLQAAPSVIGKCVGTTCPYSTLIATVRDSNNLPVGNAQVLFSILNPTGGGESVSPVVQTTATVATTNLGLGQASTQFTSGSLSSGASGIQIRAQVQGYPLVVTGPSNPPSSNDATIVIGGTAGSIAFGQASTVASIDNDTAYSYSISVFVTDSNGNPVPQGTAVNLSAWPIAWTTIHTAAACPVLPITESADSGTFYNEDINENLILDSGEDGLRVWVSGAYGPTYGTMDGLLTPPNSAAGSLPSTVYTDATGVATFTLTYPKASAIWITDRIRASTLVQGSETVSQVIFTLGYAAADYNSSDATKCYLPGDPYFF